MKLVEIRVQDTPPIRFLQVADLTDVVVFAGPNGVGKTRVLTALLEHFQTPFPASNVTLKVSATTPHEIQAWGGATFLDTTNPQEAQLLRAFLRRSQKRGELRGGVLNFDASRTFENIQPYAWSWDFADPFNEIIDWQHSFRPVRSRFQDVIHSMLRKVRSHKEAISDRALSLMEAGESAMKLEFADPLDKFKEAFATLLPGKSLLTLDQKTQTIEYLGRDIAAHVVELW